METGINTNSFIISVLLFTPMQVISCICFFQCVSYYYLADWYFCWTCCRIWVSVCSTKDRCPPIQLSVSYCLLWQYLQNMGSCIVPMFVLFCLRQCILLVSWYVSMWVPQGSWDVNVTLHNWVSTCLCWCLVSPVSRYFVFFINEWKLSWFFVVITRPRL